MFLQGKGQANGILCSSLYRRSALDASVPIFVRQSPSTYLLFFQKQQQADNWVDAMNTQDQAQKTHLALGLGGNRNSEILNKTLEM